MFSIPAFSPFSDIRALIVLLRFMSIFCMLYVIWGLGFTVYGLGFLGNQGVGCKCRV
jgi:hypothetical protein